MAERGVPREGPPLPVGGSTEGPVSLVGAGVKDGVAVTTAVAGACSVEVGVKLGAGVRVGV